MTTHSPDDQQGWSPPNPFAPPSTSRFASAPTQPAREQAPPTQPVDQQAVAQQPIDQQPIREQPAQEGYRTGQGWSSPTHADAPTRPVPVPPAPSAPSAPSAPDPYRSTSTPSSAPTSAPWGPMSAWSTGLPGEAPSETSGRREPRRRSLSVLWLVPLVLLSLRAGAAGGLIAAEVGDDGRLADAGLPVSVGPDDTTRPAASTAGIAGAVLPSVVSIEVYSAQGQATGSGFGLRQDGYLLTNNHVIAGGVESGAEIRVLFSDGSEEPATVVGRTSDYDIAVLKVERTGLEPLLLADSGEVVVGDPVVAIGAPLGLEGTVTTGIVSALNRPVQAGGSGETAFINAIQTDAAINPGNSGGPLVNAAGEVVGINSAIAQPPNGQGASGSIGLGFAIPSNQARRTAEELIETGSATYPIIGVLLDQTYTGEGVQVASAQDGDQPPVTEGGPAADAGIRPGDVIVAIDGRPVTEPDELIVSIRAKAPGDAAVLTVRSSSGSDERDVRVVLDQATSD